MDQALWLAEHPYLQPIAELAALINSIVQEIAVPTANVPEWETYFEDFVSGIPFLKSSKAHADLRPLATPLVCLVQKLASKHLPGELGVQSQALAMDLDANQGLTHCAATWLIDKKSFSTSQPGLLQYLGWSLLVLYLSEVLTAFAHWRDEERWLRNYCPVCGSSPAMAQLVGIDPGRMRFLSCGCCATRWRYRRTQCPFCERDDHRLTAFAVEGSALRIDYCEACRGYLKTYNGEGCENLLLADWMSIHLDILACDRGLERFAGSLYRL